MSESAAGRVDSTATQPQPAKAWPQDVPYGSRLLVYTQANPIADKVKAYARYIGDLMRDPQHDCQRVERSSASLTALVREAGHGYDLVIFGEPHRLPVKRLLSAPAIYRAVDQMPTSLLVARQPAWPLRKILFFVTALSQPYHRHCHAY